MEGDAGSGWASGQVLEVVLRLRRRLEKVVQRDALVWMW